MIALREILVPTDFGEPADAALTYGRALADRFGATLHVLHVAESVVMAALGSENYAVVLPTLQEEVEARARQRLDALLIDSDMSGPVTTRNIMTSSAPALAIVDYARDHDIDLIVMGTHGRTGLAHVVMGSVAEKVVRHAPCPVLTVRGREREFVRADALVPVTHAS